MPTGPVTPQDAGTGLPRTPKNTSTHWLYVAVIVAVVAGTAVGLISGQQAAGPAVLGTASVNLITLFSALTFGGVLQALFVGLVVGFDVNPVTTGKFSYNEVGGTT